MAPGEAALYALGRVANAHQIVKRCYGARMACVYCGSVVSGTADHVHPRKHGGKSLIGNLVPACLKCNQRKKDMRPAVFFDRFPKAAREFVRRARYADDALHELARVAMKRHRLSERFA